ncbi:MAG: beta-1,6-N-acetylglucosaminyltransferase [Clostridiales bacterium]|nr:beta-1,6-N-acetylglucosaminyltransferase [Clostridiales bacterium]
MLLKSLDSPNTDIYVHIDKKAKDVPEADLVGSVNHSKIKIFSEFKVWWGSYEMVQAELFLFKRAHEKRYDYYHLLSGADLPIKKKEYIDSFFENNFGYEFIHYDTDERLKKDKELGRRTRVYHFLQNYRRRYNSIALNGFFTFLERCLILAQLILHVDRMKKYPDFKIRYGSQWVSITDDLVEYILENEKLIVNIFKYTNCADELFIQSLVYNSEFKERLYDQYFDDSFLANMRLIDMKNRGNNGNPYIWRINDWKEISESQCLFARKFDIREDAEIVERIIKSINDD